MRLSTWYKACFAHGVFVAVPQSTNSCLMPGQLAKDMLTGRTLQFSSKADLEKNAYPLRYLNFCVTDVSGGYSGVM